MRTTRWFAHIVAALACCMGGSALAQIGWQQMGGAANDIGAGADGSVWVIGNDVQAGGNHGIYRWTGSTWQQMPGGAVRIAVDPQGKAWVINAGHAIYHWNGSSWDTNPGTGLDIGVGANGDVWLIGTDQAIWKWDPKASWQKKPGQALRVAVDPHGTPWVVNATHSIFRWNGSNWDVIPGGALDIGIGSEGSVWIVGTDGSVWKYANNGFVKADGILTNIAVDNQGNPWGVNPSRQIWHAAAGAQFAVAAKAGPVGSSYIATGGNLAVGQYLVADNKQFFAIQQSDGNLCVYKGSSPSDNRGGLWCHNKTGGGGLFYTVMQGDGNLCTYRGTGNNDNRGNQWCSMATAAGGQFFMTVQSDGNLCVYHGTYQNHGVGVWCSGAVSAPVATAYGTAPALSPSGSAAKFDPSPVGYDEAFPAHQPCPTGTYTVPAGINYVKITATGGSGLGSNAVNVWATLVAVGGMATGHGDQSLGSPSWANVNGGTGGHGASVSGIFPVKPGQQLYVVAGEQAALGQNSSRGVFSSGFPGGGWGYQNGGGFSMVATQAPAKQSDPNYCYVPTTALLVVAGGGGGAGSAGTGGSGGSGGDAGLLGKSAGGGGSGGGAWGGGAGGGGTQNGGGSVGSHPGCGSELRGNGSYLRGSDDRGGGGAGGGGYFGGGGGGGGDCFMDTGAGGGGGGSSYIHPTALSPESHLDTTYLSGVVIQPMQ
jgi:hypothetical protein